MLAAWFEALAWSEVLAWSEDNYTSRWFGGVRVPCGAMASPWGFLEGFLEVAPGLLPV